jgi:hypothetical protein
VEQLKIQTEFSISSSETKACDRRKSLRHLLKSIGLRMKLRRKSVRGQARQQVKYLTNRLLRVQLSCWNVLPYAASQNERANYRCKSCAVLLICSQACAAEVVCGLQCSPLMFIVPSRYFCIRPPGRPGRRKPVDRIVYRKYLNF